MAYASVARTVWTAASSTIVSQHAAAMSSLVSAGRGSAAIQERTARRFGGAYRNDRGGKNIARTVNNGVTYSAWLLLLPLLSLVGRIVAAARIA